ncbi:hypothetical protein C6352_21185 [Bacillus thuringiensis]|uniref:hypothetical protein n=1 Tax=Bacillus thuringiensis TaxID=1428 RepID=UPI000D033B82|nr:hypothetical protein [Bacillus thuringiensis]PRT08881.1 hypothetical protein C6352_21185 [Bacillus thuringiensis]
MNKKSVNVKIGDSVQFRYRHDNSEILTGSVVNVLANTIVVDVSDSPNKTPCLVQNESTESSDDFVHR